ncbi:MAG: MFS transporter [Thermoplasmataceae archaeon]
MSHFNVVQKRIIGTGSAIIALRTLGIFFSLPVFTIYGYEFSSSSLMVGLALGSYGIAMAIFQYPMGRLSDRIGRKYVIFLGMIPFIVGNLICWNPVNIYGLIAGRFIAGSGAVSSTVSAMVQENVEENQRNFAMAMIGIPVGLSFLFGTLLGPVIGAAVGIKWIFFISAVAGMISIASVLFINPSIKRIKEGGRKKLNFNHLLMAGSGLFVSVYMAYFYFHLPLVSEKFLPVSDFYEFLLPSLFIAGVVAVLSSMLADRGKFKIVAVGSLIILVASAPFVLFLSATSLYYLFFGSTLFFIGYALYDISFPPLVSRLSSIGYYGSGLGVFNSFQYGGQFVGGLYAGAILSSYSNGFVSSLNAIFIIGTLFLSLAFLLLVLGKLQDNSRKG